eukprot:3995250-Ditylum_brightwellii.AAC.1
MTASITSGSVVTLVDKNIVRDSPVVFNNLDNVTVDDANDGSRSNNNLTCKSAIGKGPGKSANDRSHQI